VQIIIVSCGGILIFHEISNIQSSKAAGRITGAWENQYEELQNTVSISAQH
jgi:hypothetical protein